MRGSGLRHPFILFCASVSCTAVFCIPVSCIPFSCAAVFCPMPFIFPLPFDSFCRHTFFIPVFLFCSRLTPSGISCSNPQGGTSPVIFSAACPAVLPPLSRRCPVLLPAHYCSERTYLQTVSAPDAVLLLYFKGTCAVVIHV